jgi:hypothetical protein
VIRLCGHSTMVAAGDNPVPERIYPGISATRLSPALVSDTGR